MKIALLVTVKLEGCKFESFTPHKITLDEERFLKWICDNGIYCILDNQLFLNGAYLGNVEYYKIDAWTVDESIKY